MTVQLSMFDLKTCGRIVNATSSPGSGAGFALSNLPNGQRIARSGPGAHPVSRFRSQDAGVAMPTSATSGPLFTSSSPSAALQRCLESKLRQRMDVNGSPEFALTWREQDMPAGPPLCRLAPSARRTAGNGCSGWRSPAAQDSGITVGRLVTKDGRPWTPGQRAYDAETGRLCEVGLVQEALASWPTPTSRDSRSEYGSPEMMERRSSRPQGKPLSKQVLGPTPSGSPARTARRGALGALNPAFAAWLMGFPPIWIVCGMMAKKSSRSLRKERLIGLASCED
jgi:hypothetical protein